MSAGDLKVMQLHVHPHIKKTREIIMSISKLLEDGCNFRRGQVEVEATGRNIASLCEYTSFCLICYYFPFRFSFVSANILNHLYFPSNCFSYF